MKVYIFGASGSGTSTLGRELGRRGFRWLDTDDFFWMPTDPMYTTKRPIPDRIALITSALGEQEDAVLSGSVGSKKEPWGAPLLGLFDLAVFIYTPPDVRIQRLRDREYREFGDRIRPGGDMYENHTEFVEWAKKYDTATEEYSIRSRVTDEAVIRDYLKCPVLRLDGTANAAENAELVIKTLETMEK